MLKLVTPFIPTISREINGTELKAKKIYVEASKRMNKKSKMQKTSWIWQHFKEFSANTALHGYNHIVRNDTTKCER